MKRIKKITAIALTMTTALTVGTITVFAADDKAHEGMTQVRDEITYDGDYYCIDQAWVSDAVPYEPEPTLKIVSHTATQDDLLDVSLKDAEDYEMTLVRTERVDDGEFYYVEETWESEENVMARDSGYSSKKLETRKKIYMNDNSDGIQLAEMSSIALFVYNPEKNDVRVADSYYLAYSCIDQTYPKIYDVKRREEGNVDTLFAARYAVVEYQIDLEIAKDKKLRYGTWLEVNVNGKSKIK